MSKTKAGKMRRAIVRSDEGEVRARVAELVAMHGGTHAKAADALGVGVNAIGKILKALPVARYTPETIEALARAAGVTRGELLAGKVAP